MTIYATRTHSIVIVFERASGNERDTEDSHNHPADDHVAGSKNSVSSTSFLWKSLAALHGSHLALGREKEKLLTAFTYDCPRFGARLQNTLGPTGQPHS